MGEPVVSARFDDFGRDGAPARLGIMGGTFDPVHFGHLACAEQAREAAGLDAVVFVPAANPSFKRDREIASAPMRLEMCRLACLPNPHFDVSDIEIARGGVTYTVDTVRALREHFPDNVALSFIVGSDSLLTLPKWRESAQIADLVRIVAVTRPGYEVDEDFAAQLAAAGDFSVDLIEAPTLDVSSCDVRRRVGDGRTLRYLVPSAVRAYIREHGLYRNVDTSDAPDAGASVDALSDEFYEARAAELATRVSAKRARHVEGVAQAAVMLARAYDQDVRKARLAGLLHDWDKGYDDDGIRARIVELGLVDEIDPWVVEHMPTVLHGPTAAASLARDFPEIPDDVLQAIERHTTAAGDMSDLDKVIYIADAIEESRRYGRIDELRALVGTVSLDELFISTYEYWTLRLIERGRILHPDTIAIWNSLVAREDAAKAKAGRTTGRGNAT